jgi:hypothetical protein
MNGWDGIGRWSLFRFLVSSRWVLWVVVTVVNISAGLIEKVKNAVYFLKKSCDLLDPN